MPDHDLVALWEAHCRYEFETRDVDATMATMVAEPYVNHVPTMTGGVGHDQLKRFYKYHFIGGNPPDTEMVPISRTVGADQVVDEMLFKFTHTSEIDWMLPGVKPTGKRVERLPSSPSCGLWTARSRTSTSTGIRLRSWCRLAYSNLWACRWPGWKPRARLPTTRARAMNS
jgi:hypothetical protein